MAEMWYYTCEGKQMDPVSIKELRRLVGDGTLKPTDMVWKEGMARWIRASSVKELFPDPSSTLDQFFTSSKEPPKPGGKLQQTAAVSPAPAKSSAPAAEPSSKKSSPPAADEEDAAPKKKRKPQDDDDDRPSDRKRSTSGGGSSVGIIIALLLGGGVLVIALIVGVVILVVVNRPNQPAIVDNGNNNNINNNNNNGGNFNPNDAIKGQESFNFRVGPNQRQQRNVTLRRGADYEVTVRSEPRHPDVDLFIFSPQGGMEANDTTVGPDSKVRFIARDNGPYRVEVHNLHGFVSVNSTVIVREVAPPKEDPKPEPQLPPDVRKGSGNFPIDLGPNQDQEFKFQVKVGHKANVRIVPTKKNQIGVNFNVQVMRDDGGQIVSDMGPAISAVVDFNVPQTQIVRVRVQNAGNAQGRGTLYFNVGD